jgi:adenosine deaminase
VSDPPLPLVDLHRHLDGNIRLETIQELAEQYRLALPAQGLEELRRFVQVTEPLPGIMAFIARFYWPMTVLVNAEVCRRVAYENVEDARREGLNYVELRFSPWFMAEAHALDPVEVVEAVVDGVRAGRSDFGVKVGLIGILSRTYGPDIAKKELEVLLSQVDAILALDLAGDEAHVPAAWFRPHFRRAREAGWHITVHAGESAGPESIWSALRDLGAERIGHGLRAVDDPLLLDHLARRGVGIESCLTSNLQTSCVPDYSSHPLRFFLERGIAASINTDDPGISGITLAHELDVAAPQAGLTPAQIHQAQLNAVECAFLSSTEKLALLGEAASPDAAVDS